MRKSLGLIGLLLIPVFLMAAPIVAAEELLNYSHLGYNDEATNFLPSSYKGLLTPDTVGVKWSYSIYDDNLDPVAVLADDINNDGKIEVVVYYIEHPGKAEVVALDNFGNKLWNWSDYGEAPVVGMKMDIRDLDNDGKKEVIFIQTISHENEGYLRVLHGENGTEKWSYHTLDADPNWIRTVDRNGDGTYDVILGMEDPGSVLCINETGILQWNNTAPGESEYGAAIADIDNDGELEIVSQDEDLGVFVMNVSGEMEWYEGGQRGGGCPCVGNVTGDSNMEFPAIYDNIVTKEITMWSYDGNTGSVLWSYDGDAITEGQIGALGDLDDDGLIELIKGFSDGLRCYNAANGSLKWSYGSDFHENVYIIVDIDDDGDLEVVASSQNGYVYCFNSTGGIEWSFDTNGTLRGAPLAVADLDKDGYVELIAASYNKVYVLDGGWYCPEGCTCFAVGADSRSSYSQFNSTLQFLKQYRNDLDFVIYAGDMESVEINKEEYHDVQMQNLSSYWVMGNHEIDPGPGEEYIRDLYPSLNNTVNLFNDGRNSTYSFEYNNTHVVILDVYSEEPNGSVPYDGPQYNWLKEDLNTTDKNKKIFVVGHEPAYPENRHVGDSLDQYPDDRDALWELFDDYSVEAYFCGHTHYYSKNDSVLNVTQVDVGNMRWDSDSGDGNSTIALVVVNNSGSTVSVYSSDIEGSPFNLTDEFMVENSYVAEQDQENQENPETSPEDPSDWGKRAPILINNTVGGELTDYQILINVTYDSDMQLDFDDLRVRNVTSGEWVPYWIEDKVNGSWCKLWFNASYIPASSWLNDTYYLYYNNSTVSTTSDGDTTFIFFDHFEGTSLDINKWTIVGNPTITVNDSILTFQNAGSVAHWLYANYGGIGYNHRLETWARFSDNTQQNSIELSSDPTTDPWQNSLGIWTAWGEEIHSGLSRTEGVNVVSQDFPTTTVGEFKRYIIERNGVDDAMVYKIDTNEESVNISGTGLITGTAYAIIHGYYGHTNGNIKLDWLFIRKYYSPDPTTILGAEEVPSIDTSFTVTLPTGYTYAHFNLSGLWNASTQTNYPPEGQSDSQAFYNITNTGNVELTIRMKLNQTIPNVVLKADTDNDPTGAKEINSTYATLYENLAPGSSVNIWLWTDLFHAAEQQTNRTIEINVTQS